MTEASEPGGGDRLDRIEENMLAIQEGLLATIKITQDNGRAIDRLAVQLERNALTIDRVVTQAEADRAIMLRILRHLENRYPGNGRGDTGT